MIFVSVNMCFIPVSCLPPAFAVQSTQLRTASTAVSWATAPVIALNHVRRLKFVMLSQAEDHSIISSSYYAVYWCMIYASRHYSFKMWASFRPVPATLQGERERPWQGLQKSWRATVWGVLRLSAGKTLRGLVPILWHWRHDFVLYDFCRWMESLATSVLRCPFCSRIKQWQEMLDIVEVLHSITVCFLSFPWSLYQHHRAD